MGKGLSSWSILILCNLMWALQFTAIKLTQEQVGPYFTVWGPMLLSTIFLLPFAVKDFKKSRKKVKDTFIFFQLALLGAFPAQVLMTWGTQYSLASNAAIITLSLPITTAVFAAIILKEKMNRLRWVSFAVAIAGVLLVSVNDLKQLNLESKYMIGNLLIFCAIVGNSYYNVGIKRIAQHYSSIELVFYTYVAMIILLTPLVLIYEPEIFSTIPHFTSQTWTGVALLTFFHNFLSMVLFFKVLKVLDAMQVALSNYLITIFGLAVAGIWLGEKVPAYAILGGVLVLLSTLAITILDYKRDMALAKRQAVATKTE